MLTFLAKKDFFEGHFWKFGYFLFKLNNIWMLGTIFFKEIRTFVTYCKVY
jgi:hypothetical protein